MAVLVLSTPLPGWIGTLLNRVQTERMKRTDARVQAITECESISPLVKEYSPTLHCRHECPSYDQDVCLGIKSQRQDGGKA